MLWQGADYVGFTRIGGLLNGLPVIEIMATGYEKQTVPGSHE
jgi:hypothetical protein